MCHRKVDLKGILQLRWWWVLIAAVLVVFGERFLGISVLHSTTLGIVLTMLLSNILLFFAAKRRAYISQWATGCILMVDTLLLALLLRFAGGPMNPFTALFFVQIVISSVILDAKWTWAIATLSVAGFASLFHVAELGVPDTPSVAPFNAHLKGMWLAFSSVSFLVAYFVARMVREIDDRERRLQNLHIERLNQERLISLTRLAMGAAHELSTPLSTIAVAAGEISRYNELPDRREIVRDAELILKEVKRIKGIISRMSGGTSRSQKRKNERIRVEQLVEMVKESLGDMEDRVRFNGCSGLEISVQVSGLAASIVELVKNALHASPSDVVDVDISSDCGFFNVVVSNSGVISPLVEARIGEPFFTTKEPGKGMGLGVYLVNLFAKECGGNFMISSDRVAYKTKAELRIPIYDMEKAA
ncbi:MAG: sensor histidine kinase [Candidatus Dadabacteria bacterium]|nr:MAG: sensor histidine kinase [Candidatus Dadabacteria bacterium]